MKRKTPKIEWTAGTETKEGMELSYVAKSVSYDDDSAMTLIVARQKDNPTPIEFWYMFALDIDPAQEVSMTFQKRGRGFAGMSFLINPAIEIPAIAFPNIVTFTESSTTLNMLQTHIDSDTIIFDYTTTEGKQSVFKFPLTGFNEKYLEQFI